MAVFNTLNVYVNFHMIIINQNFYLDHKQGMAYRTAHSVAVASRRISKAILN